MPDLVEQMYCSQQIFIPPNLPSILKKYAKAAIRTQPGDLLIWSSAYFRALAAGIPPPTKERIEYPPVDTPSGLSPGFLKVLISQIGKGEVVSKEVLEERWRGVCLNVQALQDLLAVGMFGDDVHWLEFLAICAGTLQPSLTKTMIQLCELLTEEPEGGNAAIPVSTFLNLYKYLAKLDCGPVNTLEQYEQTLKEDSETQCQAEVLEPREEVVETGVPNIDWDTAIEDGSTEAGDEIAQAETLGEENIEKVVEFEKLEATGEIPSENTKGDTVTGNPEEDTVTVEAEEDTAAVNSEEDIVAVEAEEVTAAVNPEEDTDTVKAEEETVTVASQENASTVNLEKEIAAVNPEEDTVTIEAEDDPTPVNSEEGTVTVEAEENTAAVNPGEDTAAVNPGEDTVAVEVEEDTVTSEAQEEIVTVEAQENTPVVNPVEDNAGVNPEGDTVTVEAEDDTAAVNSEEGTATVNPEEDTVTVEAENDTAPVNSEEGTATVEAEEDMAAVNPGEDTAALNPEEDTVTVEAEKKTVTVEAQENTPIVNPVEDTAAVNPEEGTVTVEAEQDTAPINLEEGTVMVEDEENTAAVNPEEGTATVTPEEETAAVNPGEDTAAVDPEEGTVTVEAEEGTATDHPEENTATVNSEEDTVTVEAKRDTATVEAEEIVTDEPNHELKHADLTDVASESEEGIELSGSRGEITEIKTDETETHAEGGSDEPKDEPLVQDAEDEVDAESEGGSNGCDSGVATADESQDPKGAVSDEVAGKDQHDELPDNDEKGEQASNNTVPDKMSPEQQVVEVVDKITSNDVSAAPAEQTNSEGGHDDGKNDETNGSIKGENPLEKPPDNEGAEIEQLPNEPQNEVPPSPEEESIIDENQGGSPGETEEPGSADTGEAAPTIIADSNETAESLPVAQSDDAAHPPTATEDDLPNEATVESAVESNEGAPDDANDEPITAENHNESPDEPVQDEAKTDETNPEEPQTSEPILNLGTVYIIDDDGTLSAAPRPVSSNEDGDLRERDSDKTIATNPSDDGLMVWPEIKPENEEVEAEPQMEKEVTSDDGIEVLTDVDVKLTQEEIKMLPEKSEEHQPEVAGNEENIFAPQIDSFTDLLEAESAPAEEFSPEELAAAEGSSEHIVDEASRQGIEKAVSIQVSEAAADVTQSTEQTQLEALEDPVKSKSIHKSKRDADIESLVKKDSEMMLLPTPVTSDIMLYVDNECEKSMQKVSPTQQLSNKMSLVDVQVAVPIDETVVEVVERHRYPKWMNIPGIGPIVPDQIVKEAEKYFLKVSELQEGMVMPRNIKHFHCPPLEMNPECVEDASGL